MHTSLSGPLRIKELSLCLLLVGVVIGQFLNNVLSSLGVKTP